MGTSGFFFIVLSSFIQIILTISRLGLSCRFFRRTIVRVRLIWPGTCFVRESDPTQHLVLAFFIRTAYYYK
jgi:hypothetical protein